MPHLPVPGRWPGGCARPHSSWGQCGGDCAIVAVARRGAGAGSGDPTAPLPAAAHCHAAPTGWHRPYLRRGHLQVGPADACDDSHGVGPFSITCGICLSVSRECCQESLGCLFAVPLWNLSQRVLPRVSGLPFCSSSLEPVSESVAKSLWVAFLQFPCGICLGVSGECCQESLSCFFAVPLWNLSQSVSLDPVEVLAKSLGWLFLQCPCGIYFSVPSICHEQKSLWVDLFCSSPVKSVWVFLEIIEESLWVGRFCSSPVKSVSMFLEIIVKSLWVGCFCSSLVKSISEFLEIIAKSLWVGLFCIFPLGCILAPLTASLLAISLTGHHVPGLSISTSSWQWRVVLTTTREQVLAPGAVGPEYLSDIF